MFCTPPTITISHDAHNAYNSQDTFRKLMADLPEQFAAPAYVNAGDHPTKIKLKMPSVPTQPVEAPTPALPSSNTIAVSNARVRGRPRKTEEATNGALSGPSHLPLVSDRSAAATSAVSRTPGPNLATAPASSSFDAVAPRDLKPMTAAQSRASSRQLIAAGFSSITILRPGVPPQPFITPQMALQAYAKSKASASRAISKSPSPISTSSDTPATRYVHTLRHAVITTVPLLRRLVLHHEDGTRTWTMRLHGSETGIILSNVTLLYMLDESSSEDEEFDGEDDASPTKGKKRGGPARKGGKASEAAEKAKAKERATQPAYDNVRAKLNGVVVEYTMGREDVWEMSLPPGISVLEFGQKGGMVWKVYLDRVAN